MLLLLLSRFSRVQLCATPETAAHQAPSSLRFSTQEHWSGLPFPSPMHESEKWKWSCSAFLTLSNPMDCSAPGSSIHGIFQVRVLEWGAIAFSYVCMYSTYYIWCTWLKDLHRFSYWNSKWRLCTDTDRILQIRQSLQKIIYNQNYSCFPILNSYNAI